MALRSAGKTAASQPLSTGVRYAMCLVIALILGFCVQVFIGVKSLDNQVERWSYLEELDDTRERLVREVRNHLEKDHMPHARAVLNVFDEAADLVDDLRRVSPEDPFSDQAEQALLTARRLFIQSNYQRAKAQTRIVGMSTQLAVLQKYVSGWRNELRREHAAFSDRLTQNSNTQFAGSEKERRLIAALLYAQSVQRRLESLRRIEGTSKESLLAAARVSFDITRFPAKCTPTEQIAAERLCAPSSNRVLRTYKALDTASEEDAFTAVNAFHTALGAYARAGGAEYARLVAIRTRLIDHSNRLRREVTDLDRLESMSSKINSLLLEVGAKLDSAYSRSERLEISSKIMDVKIAGIRSRMISFIRLRNDGTIVQSEVVQSTSGFRTGWTKMVMELSERDRIFSEFELEMQALADAITGTVSAVRSSTGLWVNIFAAVSLVAALLLGLTLLATLWGIRSFVLVPMTQVTRAVHRLANGDTRGQINLTQTAFGYEHLRDALLRLCTAMQERDALAQRNAAQKAQIERNMQDMEQTHQEMQWLAMHDPLTQLPNRRHADADLAKLTQAAASNRADFCLIHLDVDRFKQVNDTLGHEAGDFILRHVAAELNARRSPHRQCYRIGGDEFLIAITDQPHTDDVAAFAQEIVSQLARPIDYAGHTCRIGASLGIAFGRDADFDASAALVNADLALYETKRNGRNGYRFYADKLLESSRRHKDMGDRLLAAIEAENFVPFYQPQFYADGLRLRGVETLCRWYDDDLGWIPPSEFLDIADDMKLVPKIDQILLKRAAEDIRRLRELGLSLPQISFNITADRLTKIDLADDLLKAVGSETRVALELLESMSLDTLSDSVRWSIDMLKDHGVAIEIDDFGSCRASVAGLIAVGPDAMKIDASLIVPMTDSDQHLNLVRAIIEIGCALDIEVVGEGVESQLHVDMLRDLGCDVLQGFALAMPMPLDELVTKLDAWGGQKPGQGHVLRA